MQKYLRLLKESNYIPVVPVIAMIIDGFKLAMKTPQKYINYALAGLFGLMFIAFITQFLHK